MRNILLRVWVIAVAIVFAYSIYYVALKPRLFDKICLTSSGCIKIKYRRYQNSVLIDIQPTGYWIFFDGRKAFVYGEASDRRCTNADYVPAYVIDVKYGTIGGYECVDTPEGIAEFYDLEGSPWQTLFIQDPAWNNDVMSILNYMSSQNIINITQ